MKDSSVVASRGVYFAVYLSVDGFLPKRRSIVLHFISNMLFKAVKEGERKDYSKVINSNVANQTTEPKL